jgi:hypothetical protein
MLASLRANGSRERAPDARLSRTIHLATKKAWIASSLPLLAETVILRESGVSSTLRLLGFIINVSGILGRPVKPGDDNRGCGASAFNHFSQT